MKPENYRNDKHGRFMKKIAIKNMLDHIMIIIESMEEGE